MTVRRPPLDLHRPHTGPAVGAAARRAHERMRTILRHTRENPWTAYWVLLAVLFPFVVLMAVGALMMG